MASFSFANQTRDFYFESCPYNPNAAARQPGVWTWADTFSPRSAFLGSGFVFDDTTKAPTGGYVTQWALDLYGNSGPSDVVATGLNFALSQLAPPGAGGLGEIALKNLYWRTVLAGNDTVDFGTRAANGPVKASSSMATVIRPPPARSLPATTPS